MKLKTTKFTRAILWKKMNESFGQPNIYICIYYLRSTLNCLPECALLYGLYYKSYFKIISKQIKNYCLAISALIFELIRGIFIKHTPPSEILVTLLNLLMTICREVKIKQKRHKDKRGTLENIQVIFKIITFLSQRNKNFLYRVQCFNFYKKFVQEYLQVDENIFKVQKLNI